MNSKAKGVKRRATKKEVVTREFTVHLHKYIHGIGFKRRAPRAIKAIREFAKKHMKTDDIRIDTDLNKFIWSHGIRNVPYRVRVRLSRRRNEDDDAKNLLYTLVTWVPTDPRCFKRLENEEVPDD
ncbi:Ribosomal protein L31 [Oopsacas minuta]|uniref:Large ribosomal subunit protein eL31 n=1 Tax=Oopsacas minuta TaxID=111878 RepID=A0AAV7KEJ8_9METZ|nr:Ribosomal protein L31 [Oopsacas minuta]